MYLVLGDTNQGVGILVLFRFVATRTGADGFISTLKQ